jgi:hypothetical protein
MNQRSLVDVMRPIALDPAGTAGKGTMRDASARETTTLVQETTWRH